MLMGDLLRYEKHYAAVKPIDDELYPLDISLGSIDRTKDGSVQRRGTSKHVSYSQSLLFPPINSRKTSVKYGVHQKQHIVNTKQ
jgi:hypothetical protein